MEPAALPDQYFALSDHQRALLARLPALYRHWNAQINVISRKDMDHFMLHHVLHSLSIACFLRFPEGTRVLDFGTGGGFPGIPLAIMFPETQFTLVDAIGKKIKVVEAVCAELGLTNVEARKERVESLREPFHFVCCRAVAPLREIFQWTQRLVLPGTSGATAHGWLLLKGGDLSEELKGIKRPYQQIPISRYFKEPYFQEKYLLYFPF